MFLKKFFTLFFISLLALSFTSCQGKKTKITEADLYCEPLEQTVISSEEVPSIKVLQDGKEAFPEILDLISKTEKSIDITMFIWRDDRIGNTLAQALLDAADRGIKISITKDQYGSVSEMAEETRQSFFHKKTSGKFKFMAGALNKFIDVKVEASSARQKENPLAEKIISHPNITVQKDKGTYDHRKIYIFDDKILVFGGINVEDKEIYTDAEGNSYHDFMLRIDSPSEVKYFREVLNGTAEKKSRLINYIQNADTPNGKDFSIEKDLTLFIRNAESSLKILMPYMSSKPMMEEIKQASLRGVKVELLLPLNPNMGKDINIRWAEYLKKYGVEVRYLPIISHSKVMIADNKTATVGSVNLTYRDCQLLQQINCVTKLDEVVGPLLKDFDNMKAMSVPDHVKYSSFRARLTQPWS